MESGSRRKQLRPSRVNDDDEQPSSPVTSVLRSTVASPSPMSMSNGRSSSANDGNQPMFVNNIKLEVNENEAPTGIEMMSGETRGPFPVKELRMCNSEAEFVITLVDQMGNKHFFDVDSIDPLIKRIKPCPNALEANCILFHVESLIQILITRDVHYGDDLLAIFIPQQQPSTASEDSEKRYPCPKCHIAKFNNIDNLNAHQKFYCKGNPRVVVAAPPTLVPSIRHGTATVAPSQNVILVPIAYHEHQHEMVQLLGPPQTIVPVAIGRPSVTQSGVPQVAVPLTEPLLVHRGLCGVVRTPTKLQFAIGDLAVTIPIVPVEMSGLAGGLKRTMERPTSTPLDLSKRRREPESGSSGSTTPTNLASHSDVEKPFLCACGISFSADETLKAHRQYYCKLVEREDDSNKEPPKKVKTRCNHCEFEPGSLSQLSVHVRTMHNDVQAYVCRLCGYRGFSLRGIRCHMRTHSELHSLKFEYLLANHIVKVKAERKSPDNQENVDQEK